MSVYVDKSAHPYGTMIMCHMVADTPEELKAMAEKIGVQLKWFQGGASAPHFDIAKSKRALALKAGAVEVDRKTFVEIIKRLRRTWPRGCRGSWKL